MDEGCFTQTAILGGTLLLRQPVQGHRAGTDAVLLAAAAVVEPGARVVDIGSGVGTIGLALALREPDIRVRLIEREPTLAALARHNIALNGLTDRVAVDEVDVLTDGPALSAITQATVVLSNPPYYAANTIRASPNGLKARAYGMGVGHGDWLRAMLRWAAPHAAIVMIHRPEALPALLAAAERRLGGIRVLPVLPRAGQPAGRMLFGGIVGSRAPLAICAPLVLHHAGGAFTPEAEAIHRGEATLALLDRPTQKSRPRGPALSHPSG